MIQARAEGSIKLTSERIGQNLPAALTAAAILFKDEAVHRAPGDTGALRRSIDYRVAGRDAVVFSESSHAPFVEYGSGPHLTDLDQDKFLENLEDWCRRHGIEDPYPVIQAIRKRGTAARPFFRPALEAKKGEMSTKFVEVMNRVT